MAMSALGLIFTDGTDVSFDCKRAVEYLSDEAFSHYLFQVIVLRV